MVWWTFWSSQKNADFRLIQDFAWPLRSQNLINTNVLMKFHNAQAFTIPNQFSVFNSISKLGIYCNMWSRKWIPTQNPKLRFFSAYLFIKSYSEKLILITIMLQTKIQLIILEKSTHKRRLRKLFWRNLNVIFYLFPKWGNISIVREKNRYAVFAQHLDKKYPMSTQIVKISNIRLSNIFFKHQSRLM